MCFLIFMHSPVEEYSHPYYQEQNVQSHFIIMFNQITVKNIFSFQSFMNYIKTRMLFNNWKSMASTNDYTSYCVSVFLIWNLYLSIFWIILFTSFLILSLGRFQISPPFAILRSIALRPSACHGHSLVWKNCLKYFFNSSTSPGDHLWQELYRGFARFFLGGAKNHRGNILINFIF